MQHTTFSDQIKALAAAAIVAGENDFADLLRAFDLGLRNECWRPDECREAADWLRDEADRLANRFEAAADYLSEEV